MEKFGLEKGYYWVLLHPIFEEGWTVGYYDGNDWLLHNLEGDQEWDLISEVGDRIEKPKTPSVRASELIWYDFIECLEDEQIYHDINFVDKKGKKHKFDYVTYKKMCDEYGRKTINMKLDDYHFMYGYGIYDII